MNLHPHFGRSGQALILLGIGTMLHPPPGRATPGNEQTIIGRIERAWIEDANVVLNAKIDTGTLTASINAKDVRIFDRQGERWTRFTIVYDGGQKATLERRLVRIEKIKEHGPGTEHRPVVILGICISNIYRKIQVNLEDRRRFEFPLLIGRRFLSRTALVDTSKKYTSEPRCSQRTTR